jgi:hypothetical protein
VTVIEQETLEICNSAALFASGNNKKILDIQLTSAIWPRILHYWSHGPQADDTISSLVNNLVLQILATPCEGQKRPFKAFGPGLAPQRYYNKINNLQFIIEADQEVSARICSTRICPE